MMVAGEITAAGMYVAHTARNAVSWAPFKLRIQSPLSRLTRIGQSLTSIRKRVKPFW